MIKKFTTSHKGKKYNAIIESDDKIIIGKIYPARYEEAVMSNKAPEWFTIWATKFENDMSEIKKDIVEIKQRLTNIENCPTIKNELQQVN